jgi:hydroxyacylglutathione hydrolase
VTQTPQSGASFNIGAIAVKALYTPCHTQDSICWFMQDGTDKVVFTGDTLFHGGCGRFFEGSAAEMDTALNKTLAALPNDTKVYVSELFRTPPQTPKTPFTGGASTHSFLYQRREAA